MTDAPDESDELRGGRKIGDPTLKDANEQGRGVKKFKEFDNDGLLQGEKPSKGDGL